MGKSQLQKRMEKSHMGKNGKVAITEMNGKKSQLQKRMEKSHNYGNE